MDSMIAKLRVALQMDSAAFESGATRAAQQVNVLGINMDAARSRMAAFSQDMILSGQRAQQMGTNMRAVNDNAGLMRAGLQSAGYQLQDIAVQFASGQRAGVIFAQQLPQLAGSLSQMAAAAGTTSGIVGRLAGFMAGPWGVAVGVGAAVLSPLIAKLFETGKAADDATAKVFGLKDALAGLKSAPMQTLGALNIEIIKAQSKLRQAEAMPRYTGGGSEEYKRNTFLEKARTQAIADARFALQEAQSTYNVANQVYENSQKLAAQADKVGGASRASSGGSTRTAGQSAGRAYREGFEDELRKLQQTTNEIAAQLKPYGDRTTEQFARRDKDSTDRIRAELADTSKIVGYTGEQITETNRKIGESFFDMSQRAISSLQQLTNGIRSGDFLGTLSGILSVLESLGGMGVFGSKMQANISAFRTSPRADGGPVSAGRMYMVGERGPELFTPNGSGTITPNHRIGGSGGTVVYQFKGNLLTPEFWNQINAGHAVAAQAGGEIGYRKVARAGSRRLA